MSSTPPEDDLLGKTLGHFQVLSRLGAGGMGVVYVAEDTTLHRQVALKVLPLEVAADAERCALFLREARSAAAVSHPNIAVVYEADQAQGRAFIAMELVRGPSLRSLLSSGPLPPERACALGAQIARGLACAHEAGVVHRDLKPENVVLAPDGTVKLLDFGLAKVLAPADPTGMSDTLPRGLTLAGTIVGTPGYMAPEQAQGLAADHRADVFSLGVVLFELLSGERPFVGNTPMEAIVAVCRDEPSGRLSPSIPIPLAALVRRCLAKSKEERPQSAREVAEALESMAAHGGAGAAGPAVGPAGPVAGRRRSLGIAAALGILALVATAAAIGLNSTGPRQGGPATAAAPRSGGTLRIGSMREVGKLALVQNAVILPFLMHAAVAEPLQRLDESGVALPDSLGQIEESQDGLRLSVKLRDGVLLHPHQKCSPQARPATVEDLAYSIALALLAPGARDELAVEGLAEARAAKSRTIPGLTIAGDRVTLALSRPAAFAREKLGNVRLVPQGFAECEEVGDLQQLPGAGPFQALPSQDGTRYSYVRAPSPWRVDARGVSLPYLDRVELEHQADPVELLGRVRSGAVDVAVFDLSAAETLMEERQDGGWRLREKWASPDLVVTTAHSAGSWDFELQLSANGPPALQDPAVRRAIAMGIDRTALATALAPWKVEARGRFLGAHELGYDPAAKGWRYDPEEAARLLAAAGHEGGAGLPELVVGYSPLSRKGLPVLQAQLARLGVRIRGEELALSRMRGEGGATSFDAVMIVHGNTIIGGERTSLAATVETARSWGLTEPDLGSLRAQVEAERDRRKREALYARIEKGLLEGAVVIPLLHYDSSAPRLASGFFVHRASVRGLADPTTGRLPLESRQNFAEAVRRIWLAP